MAATMRKDRQKPVKRVPVQISEDARDRLKILAACEGRTMAQVIEGLIEEAVAKADIPFGVRLRSVK
jgi:predicted DNA-binding protein